MAGNTRVERATFKIQASIMGNIVSRIFKAGPLLKTIMRRVLRRVNIAGSEYLGSQMCTFHVLP